MEESFDPQAENYCFKLAELAHLLRCTKGIGHLLF